MVASLAGRETPKPFDYSAQQGDIQRAALLWQNNDTLANSYPEHIVIAGLLGPLRGILLEMRRSESRKVRWVRTDLCGWVLLVSMALTLGTSPRSFAQEIAPTGEYRQRSCGGRVVPLSKHFCWCNLRYQL